MSKHLALVDLGSGAILSRTGRDGEGPGEFRDPGTFLAQEGSPNSTWVYDFQNRRLALISIREGRELVVEAGRPFDAGASIEQPIRSGTRVLANGLFPDYTLVVLDSTGKPQQRIAADQPFPPSRISHAVGRRLLNRSYLAADPTGQRLALAYQWASRIDFFSGDGSRRGSVAGPRQTEARYTIRGTRYFWDPEGAMAYTALRATDNFVYALFCGCREADDPDQRSQRLHVFRWNGDFVREIQLDRKVTAFAVTPDDSLLYAAVTEPHTAIGEWALPRDTRPVRSSQ
jgi:hypothetical protein